MRTRHYQVFLLLNLMLILIGLSTIIPHASMTPLQSGFFNATASTNPAAPTSLISGVSDSETYTNGNSYYYNTSTQADASRYHVIWIVPTSADDYHLEVYSDASYSTLVESSSVGNRVIQWVVFRPSNTQYFWVKIPLTSAGNAVIEWEDSAEVLTTSTPRSSSSLSQTNMIEVYGVTLKTTSQYRINLTVPDGTPEFHLYLYSLAQGAAANPTGYAQRYVGSDDQTTGWFAPSTAGDWAILVVWEAGSGTYTLTLEENLPPSEPLNLWLYPVIEIPVFFGATFGLVGIIYLYRYLKNRPKSGEGK